MPFSDQTVREIYRVVVPRHDGTEVLLLARGDRFELPSVEVEQGERVVEALASAMKTGWDCEFTCLFCPEITPRLEDARRVHYQVMECCDGEGPAGAWLPFTQLSSHSLVDSADYSAIQQCLAYCKAYVDGPLAGPFAKPGWFGELRAWVKQVIGPLGLSLSSSFRQLNAGPSFCLIRFETNGPAIWFKAVGETTLREFPITVALGQLAPNYLPQILATRPEWNAWLATEVEGTSLEEASTAECWPTAASDLARLQMESTARRAELLQCGARDLRTSVLRTVLRPFLEAMATLMGMQEKTPPPVLQREQVLSLAQPVEQALSQYERLAIPDSLGHLDLNPGNIMITTRGCRFLDWAEGYVGNPFLSLEYLLQHFRRTPWAGRTVEKQLTESYAQPWRSALSSHTVAQVMAKAPLLAVFVYASCSDLWRNPQAIRHAATGASFRSLTRRLHREAVVLIDGSA